jgi:4-amino-4-deoxy-L-arabinose transferase-like glycosyltransferase
VLPVFGEETRRGLVAREMLASGNWIVPTVQSVPQLSRPPMQNWLIAAASVLTGSVDAWAIRLPSLAMTAFIAALIFYYVRRLAEESAALLSTSCYLTMHEVLEYGRAGETEAVFTGFVAGALLVWHLGRASGWSSWAVWIPSFLLVAGGMLTKGVQAPLYFLGAVVLTLLAERRLRELAKPAPLVGLLLFVLFFSAWQIAFIAQLGLRDGWLIHWLNISYRFTDRTNHSFAEHFITFPFEVFGVMLPGSLLLLPALSREVRRRLGDQHETIRFLVFSLAWAFVFVWVPPGARARYFMPLMPLAAVLMGLIGSAWLFQPWRRWTPTARMRFVIGVLLAFAALHAGPALSIQSRMCDDISGQISELDEQLPDGANLVSFGPLHHGFLYHYGRPIRLREIPPAKDLTAIPAYFAIHTHDAEPPALPFAWDEIATISCDRYRRETPRVRIHIGKRMSQAVDMAKSEKDRGGL